MRVEEAMTHRVETIGPDETLQAAAQKMRETSVGALPVCEHDRLIGMITDRDITVRAVAAGWDPKQATVRSAMTAQIISCRVDESIADAAQRMERMAIRRLVVLDRIKRLVGIFSLDDLAMVQGAEALTGEVLERVTSLEPPPPGP